MLLVDTTQQPLVTYLYTKGLKRQKLSNSEYS